VVIAQSIDRATAREQRDGTTGMPSLGKLWDAVAAVPDPEIPVVSVAELGILRGLEWDAADPTTLVVTVTPTYSGCPATDLIMASMREALVAAGVARIRMQTQLAPAWTTDWITAEGRRKLAAFGIAPPQGGRPAGASSAIDVSGISPLRRVAAIPCPRCGATRTQLLSQFGSTACKAHYRCLACLEPFDYFKPH
jgi:ring-1,2-phenylacetyl-CoA epoxidase subunit PaaD